MEAMARRYSLLATPTLRLLPSTLRDSAVTACRGTSGGFHSHAAPSTTSVSPLTNLRGVDHR